MTTTPAPSAEKLWLDRLRADLARVEGDTWTIEADREGMRIHAVRTSGETELIATIWPAALPAEQELIANALDGFRRASDMLARAASKVRALQGDAAGKAEQAKRANIGFQAKALCERADFRRFLETQGVGGPVRDERAADTRLKSLLAISSKAELNSDDGARRRFEALRANFELWRRGGA